MAKGEAKGSKKRKSLDEEANGGGKALVDSTPPGGLEAKMKKAKSADGVEDLGTKKAANVVEQTGQADVSDSPGLKVAKDNGHPEQTEKKKRDKKGKKEKVTVDGVGVGSDRQEEGLDRQGSEASEKAKKGKKRKSGEVGEVAEQGGEGTGVFGGKAGAEEGGVKSKKGKESGTEAKGEPVEDGAEGAEKEGKADRTKQKKKRKEKVKIKDEEEEVKGEVNGVKASAKASPEANGTTTGVRPSIVSKAGGGGDSAPGLKDRWAGMEVQVSGRGSSDPELAPVKDFADAKLPETITKAFGGFRQPSPIQAHAWPVLRAGRDFIGIAATGSGKTLAFGVPALLHVMAKRKAGGGQGSGPLCLMVAPTRELAQQIAEVLEDLGKPSGIQTVCVYGGTSKGPQRTALRKNPAIVVATPGRLLDLVEEGCCALGKASFVVLDEADRMLDLGFEPAIRAILGQTPKERQTVMLSATWPPAVGQLAAEFVRDPIKVTIGSEDLTANHDVTQIVEVIEDRARDARLDALLRQYHKSRTNRVLVFVLYKKEAVRVESTLLSRGWKAGAVHGDKGQADRTRAVAQFKSGAVPLLIATDVAARGLDIPEVEYVINYSFPLTTEDYVHRIGRTGRAGRKGTAHTFFTHNDRGRAGELVNVLREAGQTVPEALMKFGTTVKKKESKLYGAHFKEITADAPKAQKITFADSDDE